MKLEKFKLNKKIIKKIIIEAAKFSVGVSIFIGVMDCVLKHDEFSLSAIVFSSLLGFVILTMMYIFIPWTRKSLGIDTENNENT